MRPPSPVLPMPGSPEARASRTAPFRVCCHCSMSWVSSCSTRRTSSTANPRGGTAAIRPGRPSPRWSLASVVADQPGGRRAPMRYIARPVTRLLEQKLHEVGGQPGKLGPQPRHHGPQRSVRFICNQVGSARPSRRRRSPSPTPGSSPGRARRPSSVRRCSAAAVVEVPGLVDLRSPFIRRCRSATWRRWSTRRWHTRTSRCSAGTRTCCSSPASPSWPATAARRRTRSAHDSAVQRRRDRPFLAFAAKLVDKRARRHVTPTRTAVTQNVTPSGRAHFRQPRGGQRGRAEVDGVHGQAGHRPGAAMVASIMVGDELGLYRAMADGEPVSAETVAERTGCQLTGTRRFFRPGYATNLVHAWMPALDGVVDKLRAGAKVADIGWAMARPPCSWPRPSRCRVVRLRHPRRLHRRRQRAAEAGVADRVTFEVATARTSPATGSRWCASSTSCTTWATRWAPPAGPARPSTTMGPCCWWNRLHPRRPPGGQLPSVGADVLRRLHLPVHPQRPVPARPRRPRRPRRCPRCSRGRRGPPGRGDGQSRLRPLPPSHETPFNLVLEARP